MSNSNNTDSRLISLWCPTECEQLGIYLTNAPEKVINNTINSMEKQYENQEIDYTVEELVENITKMGWTFEVKSPERFEF